MHYAHLYRAIASYVSPQIEVLFLALTLLTTPTTSHEVTVTGEAEGRVTVTAEIAEASGLPSGSNVLPAVPDVTVVLPTVSLQLAFDPPAL